MFRLTLLLLTLASTTPRAAAQELPDAGPPPGSKPGADTRLPEPGTLPPDASPDALARWQRFSGYKCSVHS